MNPFVRVEYICAIILYPEAQCVRGEGDVQYAPLRTPNTQENKLISLIQERSPEEEKNGKKRGHCPLLATPPLNGSKGDICCLITDKSA